MTSSVCLDAVPSEPFLPRAFLTLSRLARPRVLFMANAIGTVLALATLELLVQGAEHVTYAETAFAIEAVQSAPDTVAALAP